MSDELTVLIEGEEFGGWEDVSVRRSLDMFCGSFQLILADDQKGRDWSFATQKNCVLKINRIPVLTGFVDEVRFNISGEQHNVTIAGRDKTADLVDCSAVANSSAKPFPGQSSAPVLLES
jgi:prophage tail gpP-like protein